MKKVSAELKRETGVSLRAGSTAYQWAIKVPPDLSGLYATQWAYRCSLRTTDLREANLRASKLRTEWLQRFDEQRKELKPEPVVTIGPELGPALAARIRHRMLAWDDTMRGDAVAAELWLTFTEAFSLPALSNLTLGPKVATMGPSQAILTELAKRSPFQGLTASQLLRLSMYNEEAEAEAGQQLSSGDLSFAVPLADTEARKLGMLVDWKSKQARPVLLKCLEAYRAALHDLTQRDRGQYVDTPEAPTLAAIAAPSAGLRKLRDVFEPWKASKKRGPDSIGACLRALELFEKQAGNPDVRSITRAQGDAFRAHLLTLELSSKTKHDRMTWMKSLLKYACRDLELIPRNPWEGLDVEYTTESRRSPWTLDQMKAFAALPLFSQFELPNVWKAGGAAAYWIPLLALYSGARVGELCQLRVEDVTTDEDGSVISINGEAEGSKVKTQAGWRDVPVHSELVRLGFLDYVKAMREAGAVSLWPTMKFRKGKPGAYFSDWYGEFRRSHGTVTPDLHSLRHTVRSKLAQGKVPASTKDLITGHEVQGSTGTRVYEHAGMTELREAIEVIRYPGLKLERVYTS